MLWEQTLGDNEIILTFLMYKTQMNAYYQTDCSISTELFHAEETIRGKRLINQENSLHSNNFKELKYTNINY